MSSTGRARTEFRRSCVGRLEATVIPAVGGIKQQLYQPHAFNHSKTQKAWTGKPLGLRASAEIALFLTSPRPCAGLSQRPRLFSLLGTFSHLGSSATVPASSASPGLPRTALIKMHQPRSVIRPPPSYSSYFGPSSPANPCQPPQQGLPWVFAGADQTVHHDHFVGRPASRCWGSMRHFCRSDRDSHQEGPRVFDKGQQPSPAQPLARSL